MRLRLVLAAAVILTAAFLIVQARPAGAPAVAPPAGRAPSRPALPPPPSPAGPIRNVFTYALPAEGPERPEPPSFAPVEPPEPEPFEPPAEEPIRLVGLVRKGGRLKAAVAIAGQVVVLGPGESAEGYTALSVDEDAGALLRTPEGTELALSVPAS